MPEAILRSFGDGGGSNVKIATAAQLSTKRK